MIGLTVGGFIQAFRDRKGWECEPGTRIHDDLTAFAKERRGSFRDIDELYTIFCMAHEINPETPVTDEQVQP